MVAISSDQSKLSKIITALANHNPLSFFAVSANLHIMQKSEIVPDSRGWDITPTVISTSGVSYLRPTGSNDGWPDSMIDGLEEETALGVQKRDFPDHWIMCRSKNTKMGK
jgi:hypothetical protein